MKARVLFVGRTRYRLPLEGGLERKWDALAERTELRVLAVSGDGRAHDDGVFRLVPRLPFLDGALYYFLLPWRARRAAREHRADAIMAQSPHEAAFVRIGLPRARILVEIHGDWRTSTRLYGSPARRLLSPLADAVAVWAIRRADAVRTLSPFTSDLVRGLGIEPTGEFIAFVDLERFTAAPPAPLPAGPRVLFVGVLELYKNVDGLVAAWRAVAARLPEARLRIVGDGSRRALVKSLARDLPAQAEWTKRLTAAEVASALDGSTCLVLPSRSEGLPRIAVEALCRGRAVVATRGGGIPDIVEDGANGLLVDPGDNDALAEALVRVLTDRELAERLGHGAHESSARWRSSADEFADNMGAVIARALAVH